MGGAPAEKLNSMSPSEKAKVLEGAEKSMWREASGLRPQREILRAPLFLSSPPQPTSQLASPRSKRHSATFPPQNAEHLADLLSEPFGCPGNPERPSPKSKAYIHTYTHLNTHRHTKEPLIHTLEHTQSQKRTCARAHTYTQTHTRTHAERDVVYWYSIQ